MDRASKNMHLHHAAHLDEPVWAIRRVGAVADDCDAVIDRLALEEGGGGRERQQAHTRSHIISGGTVAP